MIAENHTAAAIQKTIQEVLDYFGSNAGKVFLSITGDNGSEFAELSKLENGGIKVYFTHPYSSWEKGTNECHNRMLRGFIPKGKSMIKLRNCRYPVQGRPHEQFATQIATLPNTRRAV